MKRAGLSWLLALAVLTPAIAQVSGTAFHDRDGDGVKDAGEEGLPGVSVRVFGKADSGATVDASLLTPSTGAFSFAPGNGCYLLDIDGPAGWRRTVGLNDTRAEGSAGYVHPAGLRRYGGDLGLLSNLLAGTVRFTSMGDSIAYNWNSCFDSTSFWYSQQVRDRLRCVAPSASVNLDQAAIKGSHTEDLLISDAGSLNNVFSVLGAQPELVTISIIGNDLLDDEPPANPTQADINREAAEMLDSRANIQEILSSLVAGIPDGDVVLNTLYDNEAYACATTTFHRQWLPITNLILRDLAWGQARRVGGAEIFVEFAKQDLSSSCTGFKNMICNGIADGIHPKKNGYTTIREKIWEALDGVNLGPKDGNLATTISGADHGYLQRVLRLYPSQSQALAGASVLDAEAAYREDDSGAGASVRLGIGSEEVRFSAFPDWYDEVVPVRVIAGIRYKTTGAVTDDFYRVEASVNDQFRPPAGHAYTPTDWNYYTPLVGTGGPNMPAEDPDYSNLPVLVTPNVANYRTVSALLTKNPVLRADGRDYEPVPLTRQDLGTSQIRVLAAPVARTAGDDFQVVVDAAWLDVFGATKPRPGEVNNLRVGREFDGDVVLSFDALAASELYNVYAGQLDVLADQGAYDYGDWMRCNAATQPAGGGRLQTTVTAADVPTGLRYFLVTGRVDGVESPAGYASNNAERDRRQNRCP